MAAKKNQRRNASQTSTERSTQPGSESATQLGPAVNPAPSTISQSLNLTPGTAASLATVVPTVANISDMITPSAAMSNTGAASTPAVAQSNTVPTYAEIASRPSSPGQRSPVVTRPTTPNGNPEIIQTVQHSMHAPSALDASLATPTSIAHNGYPNDGFTTVERRRKDKGKARDNQVSATNDSGLATPSTAAPFFRTPPFPTSQVSYDARTELSQQERTGHDNTVTATTATVTNALTLMEPSAPLSNPPVSASNVEAVGILVVTSSIQHWRELSSSTYTALSRTLQNILDTITVV